MIFHYKVAPTPDKTEQQRLEELIAEHGGNLSAIARALGCSRQFATRRLVATGLRAAAGKAAAISGVPGRRRAGAQAIADSRRRLEVLGALARSSSDAEARAKLKIPKRSFCRLKVKLGIDDVAIASERQRLGIVI